MLSRRDALKLSSLAAVSASLPALSQDFTAPDYKLEIAPLTADLSPRHTFNTTAYNGQIPGPLLRLNEGAQRHGTRRASRVVMLNAN